MTDVKYLEMEDIAYKEWSDHLDFVANSHANPWLPAYGCHSTSPIQEIIHGQSDSFLTDNSSVGQQQYVVLETIVEETSDDLCSESDKSGPLGWNSDSDADSVIHRPQTSESGKDWRKQEFYDEIPKKRRRRIFDKLSYSDDDEPQENIESISLSSRSSSLIAFESLEKHCEDVVIATASCSPFDRMVNLETTRWNFTRSPDSLGELEAGSESSEEGHGFSSSGDTLQQSHSSQSSFRFPHSNDNRLKIYGSLDSLNLFQSTPPLSYNVVELSQSQNALDKERAKQQEQDLVIRDKKLTATTADLTNMADTLDDSFFLSRNHSLLLRKGQDKSSFHYKEPRRIRNCGSSVAVTVKINDCLLNSGKKTQSIEEVKVPLLSVQENTKSRLCDNVGRFQFCSNAFPRSCLSAENLKISENSGHDDIYSFKRVSNIENAVCTSKKEKESSFFHDSRSNMQQEECSVTKEGSENQTFLNINAPFSKLSDKKNLESVITTESLRVENDVEVKFNPGQNQTHMFNCSGAKEELFKQGEVEKLIATPSVTCASLPSSELKNSFEICSELEVGSFSVNEKSNCLGIESHCGKTRCFCNSEFIVKTRTGDLFFEAIKKMSAKSDKNKVETNPHVARRLPVLSTPNLFVYDEEFIRNVPSTASSLTHVPLKCYDDKVEKEELKSFLLNYRKNKLSSEFGGSQNVSGIKGVHFCPIVSEVSWQDNYSEENSSTISSNPSTDEISNRSLEELCGMEYDDEESHEVEEKSIPREKVIKATSDSKRNNCQEDFVNIESIEEQNKLEEKRVNHEMKSTSEEFYTFNEDKEDLKDSSYSLPSVKEPRKIGNFSNVNFSSGGNKAYVEKKPVTPTIHVTPTSLGHVFASDAAQPYAERRTRLSVSESSLPTQDHESDNRRENHCFSSSSVATPVSEITMKKSKSRLGGFFERFSLRRLSNRKASRESSKKQNGKKEEEREKDVGIGATTRTGGRHEDVTIIPLHGPENEAEVKEIFRSVVTPLAVSAKPPLPPNIQRMSGGSRKRSSTSGTVSVGLQNDETDEEETMPGIRGNNSMASECSNNLLISNVEPTTSNCDKPVGLLETDLDTHITVESAGRRPLVQGSVGNNKKARSLMNLGLGEMSVHHDQQQNMPSGYLEPNSHRSHGTVDDRAKSMEFLLDKENQAAVLPPENELQKGGPGERVMSEHQLRVQRSLQKLNIPDWYKASAVSQTPQGFLLKRNSDSKREHQGWPGLGSKTTSLSSLGSSYSATAKSPTGNILSPSPTPHLFTRWSTSRLNSGWNSSSTSPSGSARSSFNYRQPYLGWRSQEKLTRPRTPAERLAAGLLPFQKQSTSTQQNSQTSLNPNLSDVRTSIKEVTSAIVHYVSGVQENGSRETLRNNQSGASPDPGVKWQSSPRGSSGKLCWLESSFVGSRPLDQPETPLAFTEPGHRPEGKTDELYLDLKPHLGINRLTSHRLNEGTPTNRVMHEEQEFEKVFEIQSKPSPTSTTLDDVLESLLGLPPTSRSPSPGPLSIASAAASSPGRCRPLLPLPDRQHQRYSCGDIQSNVSGSASDPGNVSLTKAVIGHRRKSEGHGEVILKRQGSLEHISKKIAENNQNQTNRDDLTKKEGHMQFNETFVKCRYSKCGKTATVFDAKRTFKTCHNCSHVYCSRECRRAHWERHKRTCLHSRVGALCRQVLTTAKEDAKTLHHLSLLARRGYLTHGRGAVKVFFSSPELAEKFVSRGFDALSEPVFVKWSDLLPAEMGEDLFAELMKICKSYNPDTRLVLYVAVCVVSEVPTTGAVKWERQLVSRCCKLQLEKSLIPSNVDKEQPPPLPPRRSSSDCVDITREMENQETLILTSLPGISGKSPEKKIREICFTNIQRELKQRGVSLRRQFPEVYKKLCSYVEGTSEHFTPVTIYPRAAVSGKTFMCIIMPDSEPEKLEKVPKDSTRVQTIDVSIERKLT